MARIALPPVPESGHDLEDYVAGLFQSAGYFVEKNVRQRDVADVLELDAVATSYEGPRPTSVLAEAKGGRWGFTDIFKVAGWMSYLGIERGGFFVRSNPATALRDAGLLRRTVTPLRVSLVDFGDFSDPAARFGEGGFRRLVDPELIEVWRLSYRAERALLGCVRQDRRAAPERRGTAEVLGYHDVINDHVFFLKDHAERLRKLYHAYRSHPRLSAAVAAEQAGAAFEASWASVPRDNPVLAEALYQGRHPCVQAAFYVEHRARLAILKAAIDLACLQPDRDPRALPATFRAGIQRLRARPSFRRYAVLWQVFLWGCGGFYLADREDEELGWLSRQTGVPRDEVKTALGAFDDLFPLPLGSWIVPVKDSPLRLTRMMPFAFRGIGAVQRLRRHGVRNYDGFRAGEAGRRHLIAWHNGLIQFLGGAGAAA